MGKLHIYRVTFFELFSVLIHLVFGKFLEKVFGFDVNSMSEKVEISTSNPVLFSLVNKSRILVKLLSITKEAASTQRTDDCSILDNRFLAVLSRYL